MLNIMFSEEVENFVKLSYIVLDVGAKHLRKFFKEKWYKKNNKNWNSDAESGDYLLNQLSDKFKDHKNNQVYINKWKEGNEHGWDTTTLVKVMLDSGLELVEGCRPPNDRVPPLRESEQISTIRNIRNQFFAHLPSMSCSYEEFIRVLKEFRGAAKELFGEEAKNEIDEVEKSKLGTQVTDKVEVLLEDVIKDFEKDLAGKPS